MYQIVARLALACLYLAGAAAWSAEGKISALDRVVTVRIQAQALSSALIEFSKQAGVQVITPAEKVRKLKSQAVEGEMAVSDALTRLLSGTNLGFHVTGANTIGLKVRKAGGTEAASADSAEGSMRLARVQTDGESNGMSREDNASGEGDLEEGKGIPEILVKGSRALNMDIKRSSDDVQPYVVFDRQQIVNSMAPTLGAFFENRLPMNQESSGTTEIGLSATTSLVSLRGLNSNQTLILVDGRRLPPRASATGSTIQSDINGIPISMVERIEVLPSTASGIYGGGATGGVINIITRKDYSGVDANLIYGGPFDTDSSTRRMDLSGTFALEGGRTQLTLTGSYSDGTMLTNGDRDFNKRGRAVQLAHNPNAFYTATTPPSGALPNIRSQNGSNLVLKFNNTPLNSPVTFVPSGYLGPASDNGVLLATNAGRYDLGLPQTAGSGGTRGNLLAVPKQDAVSLGLRRSFSSMVDAYIDLSSLRNRGVVSLSGVPTSTRCPSTLPITLSLHLSR